MPDPKKYTRAEIKIFAQDTAGQLDHGISITNPTEKEMKAIKKVMDDIIEERSQSTIEELQ